MDVDLGCRQLPEPQGRARRYVPARWVTRTARVGTGNTVTSATPVAGARLMITATVSNVHADLCLRGARASRRTRPVGASQGCNARRRCATGSAAGVNGQFQFPRPRQRTSGGLLLERAWCRSRVESDRHARAGTEHDLRRQMDGVWYDVLRAQRDLVKVMRVLRPVLNCKGV